MSVQVNPSSLRGVSPRSPEIRTPQYQRRLHLATGRIEVQLRIAFDLALHDPARAEPRLIGIGLRAAAPHGPTNHRIECGWEEIDDAQVRIEVMRDVQHVGDVLAASTRVRGNSPSGFRIGFHMFEPAHPWTSVSLRGLRFSMRLARVGQVSTPMPRTAFARRPSAYAKRVHLLVEPLLLRFRQHRIAIPCPHHGGTPTDGTVHDGDSR